MPDEEKPRKKGPGRPHKFNAEAKVKGRSGKAFHVYLNPALLAAVEGYLAGFEFRPSNTDFASRAFEEYLASRGHWPPKGGQS